MEIRKLTEDDLDRLRWESYVEMSLSTVQGMERTMVKINADLMPYNEESLQELEKGIEKCREQISFYYETMVEGPGRDFLVTMLDQNIVIASDFVNGMRERLDNEEED